MTSRKDSVEHQLELLKILDEVDELIRDLDVKHNDLTNYIDEVNHSRRELSKVKNMKVSRLRKQIKQEIKDATDCRWRV